MNMRVKISDVAKVAGVSSSTVSHVLSGNRPISPEVCLRVRQVIESLGYRPNYAAKSLASHRTMKVGVVSDEISNSISGVLVEAMNRYLRENGYSMLLGVCEFKKENAINYLREFSSGMVDGVINMIGSVSVQEAARECKTVPTITYLRAHQECPVYYDRTSGIILALEHLWSLGHRKIGFIAVSDTNPETAVEEREIGYRQFFVRMGIQPDENLIVTGNNKIESGYIYAEKLMKAGATAIMASNDMMAVGVLQWAHQNQIRVPDELSVAGFDDAPIALAVAPTLTTVQMPIDILAEKTVNALISKIKGETPRQQEVLVPRLIIRNSTGKVKS